MEYILTIDCGSSSIKTFLISKNKKVICSLPITTYYKNNFVEQNPDEIFKKTHLSIKKLISKLKKSDKIIGMGITNQRSSFLLWDKKTSKPLTNLISWQDRRGEEYLKDLDRNIIRKTTGLYPLVYYSAPKLRWILDNNKNLRKKFEAKKAIFGTLNTYLLWNFTDGEVFATDSTNAARTLLFNIKTNQWDNELCDTFNIPMENLPYISHTIDEFGSLKIDAHKIPIVVSIGDQQSAAIGCGCYKIFNSCINIGSGAFFIVNTGKKIKFVNGFLSSILWDSKDEKNYQIEATINSAGSAIKQILDYSNVSHINDLCKLSKSRGYLINAISGGGSLFNNIKTCLYGIEKNIKKEDIIRGCIEFIGFGLRYAYDNLINEGIKPKKIFLSGGLTKIDYLVKFITELFKQDIYLCKVVDSGGVGCAFLVGKYFDLKVFEPNYILKKSKNFLVSHHKEIEKIYYNFKLALELTKIWSEKSKI